MTARVITPKQKKFADRYMETGNGSLAVKEVYNVSTDQTARSMASENLTKPNIIEYIQSHADQAVSEVVRIMKHGESDEVRLRASKDILDRAGFKPVEKSENLNVNAEVGVSPEIRDLTKILNETFRHQNNGSEVLPLDNRSTEVQGV